MVFDFFIPVWVMLAGGLTVFAVIVFEVLVGLRIIKLGRHWTKYHRWTAYSILAIAALHGGAGILFLTGWRLF